MAAKPYHGAAKPCHNVIRLYSYTVIRLKPERAGGLVGSGHFGDSRSRLEHRCFFGASLTASISPSGWVASWKGHPWIPCDEQGISRSQWSSHLVPWHARTGDSRYTAYWSYCIVYYVMIQVIKSVIFITFRFDILMDCIIQVCHVTYKVTSVKTSWKVVKLRWRRPREKAGGMHFGQAQAAIWQSSFQLQKSTSC